MKIKNSINNSYTKNKLSSRIDNIYSEYTDNLYDKTVLLLNGAGLSNGDDNNTFIDNSPYNHTITSVGIVGQGPARGLGINTGTASMWEANDGVTDSKVLVAHHESLDLLDQDFTIECWVNIGGTAVNESAIVNKRATLTSGYSPFLIYYTTGQLRFYSSSNNSSWNIANAVVIATPTYYTWHHIAVTRSGSTFKGFFNGELVFNFTNSSTLHSNTANVQIGRWVNTIRGMVSDLRILKGTALYTEAFTPPTEKLTAIPNTSLLCNFDNYKIADPDGRQGFITYNVSASTAVTKYNETSLYFDGTGGLIADNPVTEVKFGTGDFTIELWVYPTVTPTGHVAFTSARWPSNNNSTNTFWFGFYAGSTRLYFAANGNFVTTESIPLNEWTHVALVRAGGSMTIYVNGIGLRAEFNNTDMTGDELVIGDSRSFAYPYVGYMDDFRITAYARYTKNFTPPSRSLPWQRS